MQSTDQTDDLSYHLLLAEQIMKDPALQKTLKVIKGRTTEAQKNSEAAASQKLRELVQQGKCILCYRYVSSNLLHLCSQSN